MKFKIGEKNMFKSKIILLVVAASVLLSAYLREQSLFSFMENLERITMEHLQLM